MDRKFPLQFPHIQTEHQIGVYLMRCRWELDAILQVKCQYNVWHKKHSANSNDSYHLLSTYYIPDVLGTLQT